MGKSESGGMKENPTVVSLFSGCGGLDLGFKNQGFDIIWANDILDDACTTYRENIGNHIERNDILNINISEIPKADFVIGGSLSRFFWNRPQGCNR